MCKNILACALIIGGTCAAVVCIIGLAIPLWAVKDSGPTTTSVTIKTTIYEGLWQQCQTTEIDHDTRSCTKLWDIDDGHTHGKKAVLAMCFIGVIVMLGAVVVMALHLTLCTTFDFLTKISGILAIAAGLFVLIGVIVYATEVKDDLNLSSSDLNAGFGLCLAACIAMFIIGGLSFFAD